MFEDVNNTFERALVFMHKVTNIFKEIVQKKND